MRRSLLYGALTLLFLPWYRVAGADDIHLPAGTLLRCTLDEPNLSTNTAEEGDPVLCRTTLQSQLGRSFARSAYLVGRLGASKDPGHFFGKGYLKLEFDRMSLANADLPISAKVISVRGYKVNRQGNIMGKGHATRDAVMWMLPPLWPWKFLALPARGPRPTLKGEVPVTLRLMNPVLVPDVSDVPSGSFGRRLTSLQTRPIPKGRNTSITEVIVSSTTDSEWRGQQAARLTLIVLREGTTRGVSDYWLQDGRLNYVLADGSERSTDWRDIDWTGTNRLNAERGIRLVLRSGRQLR